MAYAEIRLVVPQTAGYHVAYVGNIAFAVGAPELHELFKECNVKKVRLHTDRHTGQSKGFAHVHFKDEAALDQCVLRYGTLLSSYLWLTGVPGTFELGMCLPSLKILFSANMELFSPASSDQPETASITVMGSSPRIASHVLQPCPPSKSFWTSSHLRINEYSGQNGDTRSQRRGQSRSSGLRVGARGDITISCVAGQHWR